MAIVEEVDARSCRCTPRQGALVVDASLPRRAEGSKLGEPARAELLAQPDQLHEHLGGRLGIGQRTMAWRRRHAEELRQRGEPHPPQPAFEQAARQGGRAERRLRQAPPVESDQVLLEEALVEASVVRDEQRLAGEGEELPHDGRGRRRGAQLLLPQAGEPRDRLGQRHARIDERLERIDELETANTNSAELADPVARGRETGRLQVEDHELRLVEQGVGLLPGERDAAAETRDPAVPRRQLPEQRAGEPFGDRRRREERPRGLDRRQRAAFLERVDQAVERVERELHRQSKANIRSFCKRDRAG